MKKSGFIIFSFIIMYACTNSNQKENHSATFHSDTIRNNFLDTLIAQDTADSDVKKTLLKEVNKDELLLMASGAEPGWTLSLFKDKFLFIGNYGQDTIYGQFSFKIDKFPIVYQSKELQFKIDNKKCIAASGIEHNISVEGKFLDQKFQGCGNLIK